MLTPVRWGEWLVPVALLVLTALTVLTCAFRKRRHLEGSYQPSQEEKKQARHQQQHGAERPGLALPLPCPCPKRSALSDQSENARYQMANQTDQSVS